MSIPDLPRASGGDPGAAKPDGKPAKQAATADMDLSGLSVTELLTLYTRIEALLPARSLKDVSIEKTLVLQLLAAQELQKAVLEDEQATPTQKSQVTNTLSGVIDALSKLQIKLFSSERMKELEACLIDTMNEHMTPEQAAFFMQEYRRRLGADAE